MLSENNKYEIPALTGVRGFAALWVLVLHTCFGNVNDYGYFSAFDSKINFGYAELFILRGYLAVDLFFILSGFILAHTYQDQFKTNISVVNLKRFYIKRLARIYPVHLFVALILSILFFTSIWQPVRPLSPEDVVLSMLLVNVWSDPSVNIPAWSVSAEWFAYLLCPLILFALARAQKTLIILGMIAGICVFYPLLFHAFFCCSGLYGGGAILRVLSGFIGGVLLYKLYDKKINPAFHKKFSDIIGLSCLIIIFLLAIMDVHFSIFYPFLFIFIYFISFSVSFLKSFFSSKIMVFLGAISYCIYMIHYPILEVFGLIFSDHLYSSTYNNQILYWIIFTTVTAITILTSWIVYRYLEKPMRNFINDKTNFVHIIKD